MGGGGGARGREPERNHRRAGRSKDVENVIGVILVIHFCLWGGRNRKNSEVGRSREITAPLSHITREAPTDEESLD